MKKIAYVKNILKMAGGRMHTPHPIPLDSPLAISYRNYQKSLAYFSHLRPLVLFFFTKKAELKGGGGVAQCPRINTHLLAIMAIVKTTLRTTRPRCRRSSEHDP